MNCPQCDDPIPKSEQQLSQHLYDGLCVDCYIGQEERHLKRFLYFLFLAPLALILIVWWVTTW